MWIWDAIVVGLERSRKATLFVLTLIVLGVLLMLLPLFNDWFAPKLRAAVGDYALYRATVTQTYGTTPTAVTWNTDVTEGTGFSLDAGNTNLTLSEAGHYLVLYNVALVTGSGSNRSEIQSYLRLAGWDMPYGRSSCYIRRTDGVDECWLNGATVIQSTSTNQVLSVFAQRTDSNSATVQRATTGSGFSVIRLNDQSDYARIYKTSSAQTSNSATFAGVSWDVNEELDSSAYSRSGAQITIAEAGNYLVTSNVMFQNSSGSQRRLNNTRLTLNGFELPGTQVTAYTAGSNGTQDAEASFVGIITATTTNQVLELQHSCTSSSCGGVTIIGNQTGITITRLRDEAEFVRLHETTGGQAVDGTNDPITWDTQNEVEGSFSHSTVTNPSRIQIQQNGHYLFFGSFLSTASGTGNNTRLVPHWQWAVSGTTQTYGSFARYKRGNTNPSALGAGASGGILLENLTSSNYVELQNTDEATDDDASATFDGLRYAIQGVRLDSLFPLDVTVSSIGTQIATTSLPATDVEMSAKFVLTANSGDESVTGITLTESGTINAQSSLDNIRLYYDLDTVAPYDCVDESYDAGSDDQYGTTDTNGFSASDGTSAFSETVGIGTSSPMCVYVVLDVTASASNGETIELSISDPSTEVTIASGEVEPDSSVALAGSTVVQDSNLTQIHYHWRTDTDSETLAPSATGGEDQPILSLAKSTPRRVRIEVSNEGLADAPAAQFRLEYTALDGSCGASSGWTNIAEAGGEWDMSTSTHFTDGDNTTNIATSTGGVTDENNDFETPNGGMRDTNSQTGSITLDSTDFVELEYSVVALAGANDGTTYCFRLTDAGTPLDSYPVYPQVTISADVRVTATSTQVAGLDKNTTNNYLGGIFAIREQTSNRDVTDITITETGTIDADASLENVRLYYEIDSSSPYTCDTETYDGNEEQYGATSTSGFSAANGTATFSENVGITTGDTMCVYVVLDITNSASNAETIEVEISDPSSDVVVSGGGAVAPDTTEALPGTTTINGEVIEQFAYHWRNDDGDKTAATSKTYGNENTVVRNVSSGDGLRLRLGIDNTGSATSSSKTYRLEYGQLSSTCDAIGTWIDVGAAGGAWDMIDSTNLTDGDDTTDLSPSLGGVTNPGGATFLTNNNAVKDTSSQTAGIILSGSEFTELEYSIEATTEATFGTNYCFRLTDAGVELGSYAQYPRLIMRPNQDFYIQRNTEVIANGSLTLTLTPGVDYAVPQDPDRAFIRIVDSHNTAHGNTTGGGNQNSDDVTVYISDPTAFTTGISFERFGNAGDTRFNWEIIEYIGPEGGDNEMLVRHADVMEFGTADTSSSSPLITTVENQNDVVVFVTGAANPDVGSGDYNTMLTTAAWNHAASTTVLTRDEASGDAVAVSYAVVEFTGSNWNIQRVEHTYSSSIAAETESISQVDTSQTFLHVQKRTSEAGLDEFGHEIYLNTDTTVSFQLQSGVSTPSLHTSVAWVIENTQTSGTPMVVHRSNNTSTGGTPEPISETYSIGGTVASTSNTTIHINNRVSGTNTSFPRGFIGARIISDTQYELYYSESSNTKTFRVEVVEWPTASRNYTQNYYRFYTNNDLLDPDDPWPVGGANLGENTSITVSNEPPTVGTTLRLRMSVQVGGGVLSAGDQQFKLQSGISTTTCTAIENWLDVGDPSSTTAQWAATDAPPSPGTPLGTDPPGVNELNLSVSDRAGTYEEGGVSAVNPYKVSLGEDVEYDWIIRANNVVDSEVYCFRMVESNGSTFDAYNFYPRLIVAGFGVISENWRWYDDSENITPTSALALENTAPIDISYDNTIKLRITVSETAGSAGPAKYRLQFSTASNFSENLGFVEDADECVDGVSWWCYEDDAGEEHTPIASSTLSDADSCIAGVGNGCGTHNEYSFVPRPIGEVGMVTTDTSGTTVNLQNTYINPVIIAESITGDDTGGSGNDPAAAIITATSSNSFTVRIQEPDNEADDHGSESLTYLVMEEGTYTDRQSGSVLYDAGLQQISDYYGNAVAGTSDATCSFGSAFDAEPIVFSSLQSDNNTGTPDFLTASVLSITSSQFSCSLEVPDGETNTPGTPELYGWVAFRDGPQLFKNNTIPFQVTTTTESVQGWTDTPWYQHFFDLDHFDPLTPGFLGTKQTREGAEGGWLRYDSLSSSSVRMAFDERDDGERSHTSEEVGVMAFTLGSGTSTLIHSKDPTYQIQGSASAEHEYTIRHAGAPANRTFYFRLYDWVADEPVTATSTYPSLATEGGTISITSLTFNAGSTTEGVVADVTTTPTSIPYGALFFNNETNAVQRLSVTTNATYGYQLFLLARQNLLSAGGYTIPNITASNTAPLAWESACEIGTTTGCWGYHSSDNTLSNGSTRFLIDDTFAALSSSPEEIAYSSGPVTNEQTDVVYRLEVTPDQPSGEYQTDLVYIIVPLY